MKVVFYSLVLLMAGCSTQIQPELKQAVDETLAAKRASEIDCKASREPFCAIQSPLLYLGDIDSLKGQHHAALLDIGEDALKVRLHLIRAARHSIEIQNFLFRREDRKSVV